MKVCDQCKDPISENKTYFKLRIEKIRDIYVFPTIIFEGEYCGKCIRRWDMKKEIAK